MVRSALDKMDVKTNMYMNTTRINHISKYIKQDGIDHCMIGSAPQEDEKPYISIHLIKEL